ncbi:MAG: DUF6062 family protein [Armatimonadota bacterium]|nr:DUF6062 family protein [Armatimonadota bacterium]
MRSRKVSKHTTYFELLDSIRSATGCPLCEIEAKSIRRYFDSLLYENVNDHVVREALIRSRGYCQRHAHYLRNRGNGFGIAILYQDQVKLFLRTLNDLQAIPSKIIRKGTRTGRQASKECPACHMQNECRNRYGSTLIEWLDDQEIRGALEASFGLCVPHFLALWEMTTDAKARSLLIELQRAKMELLLNELEEFCRKHDYRFSNEEFGTESDSWSRAIRMMVGEEGIF